MKKGGDLELVIVMLVAVYLLAGCASVGARHAVPVQCPADDVIFMAADGSLVIIPREFFNTGEGEYWMRLEEYKRLVEAGRKAGGL